MKKAIFLLLLLAALLRSIIYFQARTIQIDEANLLRNYVEKPFSALWFELDYEQYAPPLFSSAMKLFGKIVGYDEFGFRLLPLLMSFVFLVYFYKILRQLLKEDILILLGIFISGFSFLFLQYATEAKQYGGDAAITVVLIYGALQFNPSSFTPKSGLKWLLIGIIAQWFSMPTVFILASIGFYWLLLIINDRAFTKLKYILPIGLLWALNFGAYFLLLLKTNAESEYLQSYHLPYMFDLPTSIEAMKKNGDIILNFLAPVLGSTLLSYLWIGIGIVGAFISFYKSFAPKYFLLILPIFFCFTASAFHYYSLISRLTLFFMPLLLILGLLGLAYLANFSQAIKYTFMGLSIVLCINCNQLKYFFTKFTIEQTKEELMLVKSKISPSATLLVHHEAAPTVIFYTQCHSQKTKYQIDSTIYTTWDYNYAESILKHQKLGKELWVLFGHSPTPNIKNMVEDLKKIAKPSNEHFAWNAGSIYFDFR